MHRPRGFPHLLMIPLVVLAAACTSNSRSSDISTAVTSATSTSTTSEPVDATPDIDAPNTDTPHTDTPNGGSTDDSIPETTGASTSSTAVERPTGPVADLSEELSAGNGPFIGSATGAGLDGTGYVEHEFVAAGTATSYRPVGELGADGHWTLEPDVTATYRTRIVVRRPATRAAFSGTVVVEWMNVSGGLDADPDYSSLREELIRHGDAWVGVSAQLVGIAGGPVLVSVPGLDAVTGGGLVSIDPARYSSLSHPGDGFSFDIYTQVARAIRAGGPAMGGLQPDVVIAAGESQSAIALTTYIDGVQPLTRAFDGFFVHSRASVALPLVGPGEAADLARGIGGTPTLLRDDTDVPIMELQSEGDVIGVLNSIAARQPDSKRFRLWEVAGTSHADVHLLGSVAATIDCGAPINNGALHVVAKAAYRALDTWVRTGTAPPIAPRLETTDTTPPALVRDSDGIAVGGIRTPTVDVPVDVLSGAPGPKPSLLCLLLGSTVPLPPERLAALYSSRADYLQRFTSAADATISAGFVLPADRDALLAFAADPSRISS